MITTGVAPIICLFWDLRLHFSHSITSPKVKRISDETNFVSMNYHLPVNQEPSAELGFAVRNKELVTPSKVYRKSQYPNLPNDMVKIMAQDGRNIFLPITKFKELSTMDF